MLWRQVEGTSGHAGSKELLPSTEQQTTKSSTGPRRPPYVLTKSRMDFSSSGVNSAGATARGSSGGWRGRTSSAGAASFLHPKLVDAKADKPRQKNRSESFTGLEGPITVPPLEPDETPPLSDGPLDGYRRDTPREGGHSLRGRHSNAWCCSCRHRVGPSPFPYPDPADLPGCQEHRGRTSPRSTPTRSPSYRTSPNCFASSRNRNEWGGILLRSASRSQAGPTPPTGAEPHRKTEMGLRPWRHTPTPPPSAGDRRHPPAHSSAVRTPLRPANSHDLRDILRHMCRSSPVLSVLLASTCPRSPLAPSSTSPG